MDKHFQFSGLKKIIEGRTGHINIKTENALSCDSISPISFILTYESHWTSCPTDPDNVTLIKWR